MLVKYMAECNVGVKIRKSIATIRDEDARVWTKAYAVSSLLTYSVVYAQLKVMQYGLAYGPECLQGALTGNVTGIASAACDIVTSLLLIGDVRDFAFHSWYLWFDTEDDQGRLKFDQATYVFSILGIAGNLAEIAGLVTAGAGSAVAAVADAAFAGMKTFAKLVRSTPLSAAIGKYAADYLAPHWADWGKLVTALELSLPFMQMTAQVMYVGPELAPVLDLIKQIDANQLVGWFNWAKLAITRSNEEAALQTTSIMHDAVRWLIPVAHAITRDAVVKLLDDTGGLTVVVKMLAKLQAKGTISSQHMNDVISSIGADLSNIAENYDELHKVLNSEKALGGIFVAYASGLKYGETKANEIIDSLKAIKCVWNSCYMGGLGKGGPTSMRKAITKH